MTKWSSYFWHFSCVPTQEENYKRHCAIHWMPCKHLGTCSKSISHGPSCTSKSIFQQFHVSAAHIYKMPKVCPEHTWNPQLMSPQTANPSSLVLLLMPRAPLLKGGGCSLPSKLHRYHYTLQILLQPISTINASQKSRGRLEPGLHRAGVFYFGYTPHFMLQIHWKNLQFVTIIIASCTAH